MQKLSRLLRKNERSIDRYYGGKQRSQRMRLREYDYPPKIYRINNPLNKRIRKEKAYKFTDLPF